MLENIALGMWAILTFNAKPYLNMPSAAIGLTIVCCYGLAMLLKIFFYLRLHPMSKIFKADLEQTIHWVKTNSAGLKKKQRIIYMILSGLLFAFVMVSGLHYFNNSSNCLNISCANDGKCIVKTDGHMCHCKGDYTGLFCSELCYNDSCICTTGYTGELCNHCDDESFYYGHFPFCQACDCDKNGSLSAKCDSSDGTCSCSDHFEGQKCDSCIEGYFGSLCEQCSPDSITCSNGMMKLQWLQHLHKVFFSFSYRDTYCWWTSLRSWRHCWSSWYHFINQWINLWCCPNSQLFSCHRRIFSRR